MMVVGSTMNDVMKVTPPPLGALKEEKTTTGREGGAGYEEVIFTKCPIYSTVQK